MTVELRKEQGYYVGVVTDDYGNLVGITRRCHDRREAMREANKMREVA